MGAALCAFGGRAAAGPVAGTPILNTATGSGVFTFNNAPFVQNSNTVRALVQPFEAVRLVANRGATVSPGLPFAFAHRLTNTGNDTFDFRLDLANATGDGFDATSLALIRDVNGNGAFDAGDVPMALGGVITLGPGIAADLIAGGIVPFGAPGAQSARIVLSATGLVQGAFDANVDTLSTPVAAAVPLLRYFTAPDYATIARFGTAGQPLYVELDAPGWDRDPARPDSARITFASAQTGDVETYLAFEIAPSGGVFRIAPAVPTAPGAPLSSLVTAPAAPGDATVTTARGDVVTATAVPAPGGPIVGSASANAQIWMDPGAMAFDARSDAPSAGVVVALIDVTGQGNGGVPGGPARVLARDGVTPAPATVTSDGNGMFEFALVQASTYRFAVTPASGQRFPSTVAPGALAPGHLIDPAGSYGGAFTIADSLAPVTVDVPLDGVSGTALFVEKAALRPYTELGETMDYELRVANRSDAALDSIALVDRLPGGFAYVAGTAHGAGGLLADPAGGGGPVITFALGTLLPGETRLVRYRARVGAGAVHGDGVNRAWATSGALTSNVASARVELIGGVFAREASILGRVFVDTNRDGMLGAAEPGLPGVRLYLDDGTFTVTDADGRYSFYAIAPRTHALKVDPTTLPPGAQAFPVDAREHDTPGLAFVDPGAGDMVRSDWSVPGDTTLIEESRRRLIAGAFDGREIAREVARGGTPLEPRRELPDARTLPASAITTGEARLPLFPRVPERTSAAAANAAGALVLPAAALVLPDSVGAPLEGRLGRLGAAPGFVDFPPRDTVATDQVLVRVKGPLGAAFRLVVNGAVIPESRVGKKLSAPDAGVEAWEFVGVKLTPGVNRLELWSGVPRPVVIELVAPDRPGRIEITAPPFVAADGFTPARIEIALVDGHGVAVARRTLVTLDATLGRLYGEDLDPGMSGLQIAVEGGHATVALFAPGAPGVAEIHATGAGLSGSARVEFVPDLRPFVAVGALEGSVGLSNRIAGPGGTPATGVTNGGVPRPMFGDPIETFRSLGPDGDAFAGVRGAFFLKGRVHDDVLLTLAYDSDRAKDLRRLRDIQPDSYYPLYGDASVKGYEGQSTRNLYARLDRGGASLLYGDYVTPGAGGSRTLAAYSRSLNGVTGGYEGGRVRVNGYTSKDHLRRIVDEIRGRGTSGPYRLTRSPFLENTERVEIITRDRNQPSIVRASAARQRFTDYEIDFLTGELLMRAPVPSVDGDLNPVYVRVSYEVETGGEPFWITGFEGRGKVVNGLELGGSYVDDHDPLAPTEIRSVFAAASLTPGSTLEAEYATSHTPERGRGNGARFEWRRTAPGIEARLYGASTGARFANPTSGYSAGHAEAGGRVSYALSPRTRLLGEAIYDAVPGTAARHGGLLLAVDRRLNDRLRAELGTRLADGTSADSASMQFQATVRAKLTAQLPWWHGASAYTELEQDTQEWERRLAAVGGEYRFTARGRLYARHELISSFLGPYTLDQAQRQHTTVAGLDMNLSPDARVFSEYRADGVFGAREGEAALGLSNVWRLNSGARINASLERVQPMGEVSGIGPNAVTVAVSPGASTAATVAVDYTNNTRWKGSARLELRTSRASDGILSTFAGAYRLGTRWSALGRSWFTWADEGAAQLLVRERLQLGFAYRPTAGWDVLGRYELHYETATAGAALPLTTPGPSTFVAADQRRIAHVISFHGAGPLGDRTTGSLAWAGKVAFDRADGIATRTSEQWVHGRTAWALSPQWDCGLAASLLAGPGNRTGGLGAEVGRRLQPGVWMSLGYNLTGYADDDLTGEEWTRQGLYLRVRAKFDESLLFGRPAAPDNADRRARGASANAGTEDAR